MRWLTLSLLIVSLASSSGAHHPDWENQRVWPRIDLIPPLGNNLPMEYRRRFNRPTKVGGWIAYHIAPSSQEAMAWHDATHQRAYADHRGRLEKHYFYPKPWEGLQIGPRISHNTDDDNAINSPSADRYIQDAVEAQREEVMSASDALPNSSELIEQERFERPTVRPRTVDQLNESAPVTEEPDLESVELEPINP